MFLDEPTTGLDPRARADVWEIIRQLAQSGTTVILTTQHLEEADKLADRIAVIDRGRVIAVGTGSELKAQVGAGVLQLLVADASDVPTAHSVLAGAFLMEVQADSDPCALSIPLEDAAAAVPIMAALAEEGVAIARFSYDQPSLDAVFRALTGNGGSRTEDQI
jgi:ABC-2 type transport system ATP-binding protein